MENTSTTVSVPIKIITDKDYPIEKRWIIKLLISSRAFFGLLAFIFVLLFLVVGMFYFSTLDNSISFSQSLSMIDVRRYIIQGGIILLILISVLVFGVINRATFHFSIDDKFLTLRQGFFSKQQRHIPYGVIQNIIVEQSFFDRIFGLSYLALENASSAGTNPKVRSEIDMAGFINNRITIPGLSKVNAESLKNIILQKIKENPIEDNQSGL